MRSRVWTVRMAALLAAASFAVHQLRFMLAYGSRSDAQLAHQGHGYLSVLAPLVVGALMLAIAEFARGLARGRGGGRTPSLQRLWTVSTASLIGVYCGQELIEGFLASGHPDGLAGIFGAGGWRAIPISVVAGLMVSLMMRGAAGASEVLARAPRLGRPHSRLVVSTGVPSTQAPAFTVLLRQAAPRAPPRTSG